MNRNGKIKDEQESRAQEKSTLIDETKHCHNNKKNIWRKTVHKQTHINKKKGNTRKYININVIYFWNATGQRAYY